MSLFKTRQRGTQPPVRIANLTRQDICDARCPAAAQVIAQLHVGAPLLFCNHHYNKAEAGLAALGAEIFKSEENLAYNRAKDDA